MSISPAQVLGAKASVEHQLLALSAFTALANTFFLSFFDPPSHGAIGPTAIVRAALASGETLALLSLLPSWRRHAKLLRGMSILAISAAIYAYELVLGVEVPSSGRLQHPVATAWAIAWHFRDRAAALLAVARRSI